ncbi:hypothetical protein [Streptomyces griseoviridis]|uniref:Phage-related protein n=1 Tax=Streptomyces griseoviridis TaxID=45398 RepID=A0ABT9LF65_STRGD|nr:hypothetical protein [Streptomyces griseoviridis]MDP9682359.1 phage-related protein [Streptomyces griseoviridis]GGS82034.1 hypothetical protein GCM10010240_14270 [Streptomyces griseoviridis]
MAEDINLPDLISHLNVDLSGLSGTVADAARQGSSVGAALGGGIQRELRDLVSHLPDIPIDANSNDVDRDLARLRGELEQLSNQRIGIDIPVDEAIRRINELTPHLQRLSDEHPRIDVQAATRQAARQLDELLAAARRVDDTDVTVDVHVDEERPTRLLGILGRIPAVAGSAAGALAGVGSAATAVGAAVPALSALMTTLVNVVPAAGVAVTGLAAVKLAQGTVKLAAVGMEDALSAALDPSKAEEYSEALKKLAPAAREVAEQVRSMAPDLRDLQQDVQQEVFRGLAENLERTGKSVLPVLRTNLLSTATALGDMAAGVMGAARDLADSGTLGKALKSASTGLRNLSGTPGIVVTALGQIAAAAGPSFERLTSAAAGAAAGIGERLGRAFESGAMQDAIEHAISLLGDMADVAGNVGVILGQVLGAAPPGGGMIGALQEITASLAEVTASAEVQDALSALFETIGVLGKTAAPLLAQALAAIGPVLTALGGPAQTLIRALGDGLSPIIVGLGPVLEAAAVAVGALVEALSPLLPVVGELAAALLPALTPILDACTSVFQALAPVVEQTATVLQDALTPILAQLPGIIEPLAAMLAERLIFFLQLFGDILVELSPSLVQLGASAGELMVALAPLVEVVAVLATKLLTGLMPVITPLIGLLGDLAATFADVLSGTITNVVVPAVRFLTALLSGDFSGAWQMVRDAVSAAARFVGQKVGELAATVASGVTAAITVLRGMPSRAASALASLASSLAGQAARAGASLVATVRSKIDEAVAWVRALPSRAASALSGLGGVLVGAGASLISGFISGIRSMIPSVQDVLGGLTNSLPDWKGPASKDAKILTPAGRLLIQGFIKGIDAETTAKLRSRLESITKALPDNVKKGIGKSLAASTRQLERLVAARDAAITRLAAAEKRLADLQKARSKAASDITDGILSSANITTGHADVNSVSAITVGLQQSLKAAQEFQKNIEKLRKAGIRSDLLQQIADAGVDAGGATAAALAKATPAELKKINDLQAQLAKSAAATGNTVGDALYGAGIRAAEGLVAGLKSQEKAIEAQMRRIAENMLKTVKKTHKTRSPSRAFHALGEMDMRGLAGGVLAGAGRAVSAVRTVAADMLGATSGLGDALTAAVPTGGQLAAVYAGAAGGSSDTYNITLNGTRATPAELVNELSWLGRVGRR